ncbi:MAG: response regulator [bacterium]|nr:response regulator [bacterium]
MSRILYVEDNDDNIFMLTNRLQRKGYEIIVARDGAQGVDMARSESPALVLMDLGLPVLDGWEAIRLLKTASETSSIPIIALSAHAMAEDRERAFDAGCDDFDTKPVDMSRLIRKIEALLPGAPSA